MPPMVVSAIILKGYPITVNLATFLVAVSLPFLMYRLGRRYAYKSRDVNISVRELVFELITQAREQQEQTSVSIEPVIVQVIKEIIRSSKKIIGRLLGYVLECVIGIFLVMALSDNPPIAIYVLCIVNLMIFYYRASNTEIKIRSFSQAYSLRHIVEHYEKVKYLFPSEQFGTRGSKRNVSLSDCIEWMLCFGAMRFLGSGFAVAFVPTLMVGVVFLIPFAISPKLTEHSIIACLLMPLCVVAPLWVRSNYFSYKKGSIAIGVLEIHGFKLK